MKSVTKSLLLLVCCVALGVPHLAEARAGGGRSSGSMGSHTYQSSPSYNAQPIQRSVTQPSSPSPYAAAPSYTPGYAQPGSNHPFLTGLAGGFLGAGLASMFFGHSGYDGMGGVSSTGSAFGSMLQLLALAALGFLVFRWWRGRSGGLGNSFGGSNNFPILGSGADVAYNAASPSLMAPTSMAQTALTLQPEDYQNFMQLLEKIQLAWGAADLTHLRQYLTPEMLQYFSEELSANTSHGITNRISDVAVTEGTLVESWSEADLDYSTVHLKWHSIDFMARIDRQSGDTDYVASGDATHPVEAEEFWTFARARDGGHWLLSAIQQVNKELTAA